MPPRKHYPEEIALKIPDTPEAFKSQKQYQIAQILQKHWDPKEYRMKDYPKLYEEEYGESTGRSYFTKVYRELFGPDDGSDWTFRELFDEFESYDEYLQYKEVKQAHDDGYQKALEETMSEVGTRDHYSPRELELIFMGAKLMYEMMHNDQNSQLYNLIN